LWTHRGRDAVGREGARARGDATVTASLLSLVTTLRYRSWTCTVTVGRTPRSAWWSAGRRRRACLAVRRHRHGAGVLPVREPAAAVIVYEPLL